MKRTAALSAAGATALLLSSLAPVRAVEPAVWTVDDNFGHLDQCPGASFASIKGAVEAANPGDIVQVCPGTYRERVLVDKTLTLQGATKTENIDCFAADLTALDPTQVSIIEPPDTAFDSLLSLTADNINVSGFVLQKQKQTASAVYEAALETGSSHFGYNIHENIFFDNTLGIEFGSAGGSTFKENCLRNNRFAVSNQRLELIDAQITENQTVNNTEKAYELGTPHAGVSKVTVSENSSRDDRVMVSLDYKSSNVTITGNEVSNSSPAPDPTRRPLRSIELRNQSPTLKIIDNILHGAGETAAGIAFIDLVPLLSTGPITEATISGNQITGYTAGISFQGRARATSNTFTENTTSGNVQYGIFVSPGNTGNTFTGNVAKGNGTAGIQVGSNSNTFEENTADENGAAGIRAVTGTSGNTFNGNSMHRNGGAGLAGMADAVDLSGNPVLNTWTGNSCTTDIPDGLCALP